MKLPTVLARLVWLLACLVPTYTENPNNDAADEESFKDEEPAVLYDFSADEYDCPPEDAVYLFNDKHIPWGVADRALKTLPSSLYVAPSVYPDAGLGVFTTQFIPRYTWLGEYEGEILPVEQEDNISWYAWSLHRNGDLMYYVDARDPRTSSYPRYVNTAVKKSHENVLVAECQGRIFYLTCKDIPPHSELLVFYGEEYLTAIGINMQHYYDDDTRDTANSKKNASSNEKDMNHKHT